MKDSLEECVLEYTTILNEPIDRCTIESILRMAPDKLVIVGKSPTLEKRALDCGIKVEHKAVSTSKYTPDSRPMPIDLYSLASEFRHEFVMVEHLLLALLNEEDVKRWFLEVGVNTAELTAKLSTFIQESPVFPDGVQGTPLLTFASQRAIARARISSPAEPHIGGIALVRGISFEADSEAARLMCHYGLA
jgi:hypothetical protein